MRSLLLALLCAAAAPAQSQKAPAWNQQSAAAYLDARMAWWAAWPNAARDHGTFCVSCHTSLPYALARPALRSPLGETAPSPSERAFLDNMLKRVSLWDEVAPFYNDAKNGPGKSAEARATEAVMNALALARFDVPESRNAMRNMWALQLRSGEAAGSWTWLNFHNEPWEADDSAFFGASLGALAAGYAPSPEYRANVELLAAYVQRNQETQSELNRAIALWASGRLPQLLTPTQRTGIADDISSKQRPDGGWCEASLTVKNWKRKDGAPLDDASDGYATGLMVLALRASGARAAQPAIARGMAWLERNQNASGGWTATSMNKNRDPATDAARFMSDAATAYAVLALSGAGK